MPFRIRSILIASDLAESGRQAVRTASALSALTGAELHVIHVVEPAGREGGPHEGTGPASRRLEEELRGALPPAAEVSSSLVASGPAPETILKRAAEVEADLIVIGPHRQAPGDRKELGTTADRILRTSGVPCLIVRGPLSLPLRRVLVPSDFSHAARGALDLALEWAAALRMPTKSGERTRIEVFHVLTESSGETGAGRPRDRAEAEATLGEEVAGAEERTGVASSLAVGTEVSEEEDPADRILRRDEEYRADLMVLGTRGANARPHDTFGSVSSAVARRAPGPVLLVPPGYWKIRQDREEKVRPGS